MRSGSARKSISAILPSLIVVGADRERPPVEEGDDPGSAVYERAPHGQVDARPEQRLAGDRLGALEVLRRAGRATVGPEHDVGIEHRDERVEITLAGGCEERLDDLPLGGEVCVRDRIGAAHAPARPARELPRRLGRALHDRGDLLERHGEHVVQDEGQPFGRGQPLEHDQQRQTHRVGEQRLVLGVGAAGRVDDRVGNVHVERLLAPRSAGAEHVQRDPGDDRRQPAAEVLDLPHIGPAKPQPGVLDGVVGLAEGAEHPVGDRPQVRPLFLELPGEPFLLIHVTFLLRRVSSR